MTAPEPLAGRVALVTGASRRSAIGAALVRRLIADGAAVLVHSWAPADGELSDPGGVEELIAELHAAEKQLVVSLQFHLLLIKRCRAPLICCVATAADCFVYHVDGALLAGS